MCVAWSQLGSVMSQNLLSLDARHDRSACLSHVLYEFDVVHTTVLEKFPRGFVGFRGCPWAYII